MRILLVQRQRLTPGVFAAIVALCLAALGTALVPDLPAGARVAALAACGVLLLAALELERLTIIVTESAMIVGFRLFKSRTRIAEIESARPTRVKLLTHGIGAHRTFSGATALTARAGPGIEVARRGRGPLVFSCDDPGAVLDALAEAGASGVAADRASAR